MSLDTQLRAQPVQQRARERLDSIHAAARQHYMEVGRDRFNLDVVAASAGCSVATIYRYYPDRVALMDAAIPDRDWAEKQLDAIRKIKKMHISRVEKWAAVEKLLGL